MVIGVVGGLEFAAFFYLADHISPLAEYQYIASGLMGPAAFAGGVTTALIGVLLHFAISFVIAAIFLVAAAYIGLLRRVAWLSALVYGVAANMVMGMVILPLSAAPKQPLSLPLLLNGMIGDTLFIGIPLAITVWLNTHTVTIAPKAWRDESPSSARA